MVSFPKLTNKLKQIILEEEERKIFLARIIYAILGIISFFMTIINVLTGEKAVMISTLVFFILCFLDLILTFINYKCTWIASELFQLEMILLFSFFILSGSPEGFSAFWTGLLPLCGMLLWGIKRGAIDSIIMFLIVIFFCWTDLGNSLLQFDYTETFLLRFPFLYIAFFAVSFMLCIVLFYVQNAYSSQSKHDPLTKALNRAGFTEYMHGDVVHGKTETVGFIIMDLDHFKNVNDTYGHQIGDKVLVHAINLISSIGRYKTCRWGGEEFAVYCFDGEEVEILANEIVQKFRDNDFVDEDIRIHQTISVGGIVMNRSEEITMNDLSRAADQCLYEAKNTGRNKAVVKRG